jgi:hypothetical protein
MLSRLVWEGGLYGAIIGSSGEVFVELPNRLGRDMDPLS